MALSGLIPVSLTAFLLFLAAVVLPLTSPGDPDGSDTAEEPSWGPPPLRVAILQLLWWRWGSGSGEIDPNTSPTHNIYYTTKIENYHINSTFQLVTFIKKIKSVIMSSSTRNSKNKNLASLYSVVCSASDSAKWSESAQSVRYKALLRRQ